MTPSAVCPFCNAFLPVLVEPPLVAKLPCPRCGELVPAERWQVDPTLIDAPSRKAEAPRQPGTRQTAFTLLGVMLAMALIGMCYALWTVKERRRRDPQPIQEPIAFRKPLELSGLGYLPTGSQLVVGLQIAEMMDDKQSAGRDLLAPPRPDLLNVVLQQIPRTTGLPLEQIDHVVAATSFDALFTQLVLVVKTRPKYALEKKIAASAQPTKTMQHEGKPLYEYTLKPIGQALLWGVDDQTLIYVIRWNDAPTLEHLAGLSATPRPLKEVLLPTVEEAMQKRLPKHQYLWAVGQVDQLGSLKDLLPLMLGARPELALLKETKTIALGLEPLEGLTLTGHLHMNDAQAAAQLKTYLEGVRVPGATAQKVEAPPIEEKEQWVTWQVRSDVKAMRALMNGGK